MPQMGESVVEGTVTKWLVKEGDRVTEDQPLCEISTDKVDTEIPSPAAGTIAKLIAAEGQTLPIGSPIALIESGQAGTAVTGGSAPPPNTMARRPSASATPSTPSASVAVTTPATAAASAISETRAAQPLTERQTTERQAVTGASQPPRRYSPVVLRMAEEHAFDLDLIPGTGIGGRVSKRDVERYLESLRHRRLDRRAD